MTTGCLLITNNVASTHETEFNAWYQGEHLADRLGVPGFLTARRYQASDSPQRYGAIYETQSPEVLLSPSYGALLRAPSPRTSAIMPYFQDVTRIIGRVAFKSAHGAGGAVAVLFIEAPGADDALARRIGERVAGHAVQGVVPEAVRVVVVVPDNVGVDTPESKMRPTRDRRADVVLIAEWVQATPADLTPLRASLAAAGWRVETDRGGLYQLICARHKAEAA